MIANCYQKIGNNILHCYYSSMMFAAKHLMMLTLSVSKFRTIFVVYFDLLERNLYAKLKV